MSLVEKNIMNTITERLKFVASGVFDFLLPFIKQLITDEGKMLIQVTIQAVTTAATTMPNATGAEKRDAVFAMIVTKMASSGYQIATSVINSAIETAVLKIKADKGLLQ